MSLILALIGSLIFTPQTDTIFVGTSLYSSTQFLDFDNDGDLDILVCSEGLNSSLFLENIGNSQFIDITETIPLDYSTGIKWATVADLNNDGLADLITVNTFDEKVLKISFNKGGSFSSYKSVNLPSPLLTNPVAVDYDSDSLLDILLPTSTGLYVLDNRGNGYFSVKQILNGFRADLFYVFDFDGDPYPDILAKSDEEWFILNDFQTPKPGFSQIGFGNAFLVPFAVSLDSLNGILVFQPSGFITRILPPLNHILMGILQLDSPLIKVLPLSLHGDTVVMLAQNNNNELLEIDLGRFNVSVELISNRVVDFDVVRFNPSLPPSLAIVRSDSMLLIRNFSSLMALVPDKYIPPLKFVKSNFITFQNAMSGSYIPFLGSSFPECKEVFVFPIDSVQVKWWSGETVKLSRIEESEEINIPLHQVSDKTQPYRSGPLKVFPNPANKIATIQYRVTSLSLVELTVTTLTGQRILDIERAVKEPGTYSEQINLSDLLPGRYIVQLKVDGETYQRKLIVLH